MPLLFIFLLGLEFGSFANVCIYRWPRQQSVLWPARSFCPWCHETIRWWQNIPVVSFLFLKGRCYFCRSFINLRYPAVELTVAVFWVISAYLIEKRFDHLSWPFTAATLVFMFVVVLTTLADWEWKIIPDQACFLLLFAALVTAPFNPLLFEPRIPASIVGAAVGAFFLYLISVIGQWVFGRDVLGQGDIKLMAAIGSFLGWKSVLAATFLGSLLGSIFVFVMFAFRHAKPKQSIPFGPFLNAGALIQFFVGERVFAAFFF